MEIFGIPVVLIIIALIFIYGDYAEKEKQKKENPRETIRDGFSYSACKVGRQRADVYRDKFHIFLHRRNDIIHL